MKKNTNSLLLKIHSNTHFSWKNISCVFIGKKVSNEWTARRTQNYPSTRKWYLNAVSDDFSVIPLFLFKKLITTKLTFPIVRRITILSRWNAELIFNRLNIALTDWYLAYSIKKLNLWSFTSKKLSYKNHSHESEFDQQLI